MKKAKINRTVEVLPNVSIDVDRKNRVVGVEILSNKEIKKL